MIVARTLLVRGVVQGVGFRPHAHRLAIAHRLTGWVRNLPSGVEIRIEGAAGACDAFAAALQSAAPPAAVVDQVDVHDAPIEGHAGFLIRESQAESAPVARISPDLPVCDACVRELRDPANRRYGYACINCTDCGPRYSITTGLPYDRSRTTMADWPLCPDCGAEYHDPGSRRFHAEPVACPACGPVHRFESDDGIVISGDAAAVTAAVACLGTGGVVAVKGVGGYHLMCDAHHPGAVAALRERKYRKDKPFALLVRDMAAAESVISVGADAHALLNHPARPIVLATARTMLPGVAPGIDELGVMLPSTPLQVLLFDAGAPAVMVCTSGNRSSEPIAYRDEDARARLGGIADGFLIGERPIARRVEDSVVRPDGHDGPMILRRSRGLAPGIVATFPCSIPILALGADLKNTVTLVVDGQAFMSPHLGDLDDAGSLDAFREAVGDLLAIYRLSISEVTIAVDSHPGYRTHRFGMGLAAAGHHRVQHHRAHVASVLAERGAWDTPVVGVSFDGTGYGDDGTIWGGEFLLGSLRDGLSRVAHLRSAVLAGGDAAVRLPAQGAAGFVRGLAGAEVLLDPPFELPARFRQAQQLIERGVRTTATTSVGRLFDTAAALLGYTGEVTYEGQAGIWLEQLAMGADRPREGYELPFVDGELDYRPLLERIIADRLAGVSTAEIARAFHDAVARGASTAAVMLAGKHGIGTVVLSGGVFQNRLLLGAMRATLAAAGLDVWCNRVVPPNDGGISLGQAAIVAEMLGVGG
ncbi:MAG: carbamoyltransferase HypF [Gemmatimonadales bacterium]|nr:carbamoyltransferase HypF [Gemmatimonadales bacterium]